MLLWTTSLIAWHISTPQYYSQLSNNNILSIWSWDLTQNRNLNNGSLGYCLRVSNAVIKYHDKRNFRRKGFISPYIFYIYHWGKLRQELKQGRGLEAELNAEAMMAYRLVLNGLLTLLSYGIQDNHQRMTPPKSTESLIKKIPCRLAYSLWRHFPYWCSLLSDCSSLCQVELKLLITQQKGNLRIVRKEKVTKNSNFNKKISRHLNPPHFQSPLS